MTLWRLSSLLLLTGLIACSDGADLPAVSLEQARADHEAKRIVLIDIREPKEHATGVAAGAKLLPMSQLGQRLGEIVPSADKPVYLICNTQNRSQALIAGLLEKGYKHVHYVHGGMSGWASKGWPMVPPAVQ